MAERESDQAEYDRKKAEREAEHVERRARLGHETPPSGSGPEDPAEEMKPGPTGPASDADDKPKPRGRKSKEHAESEE